MKVCFLFIPGLVNILNINLPNLFQIADNVSFLSSNLPLRPAISEKLKAISPRTLFANEMEILPPRISQNIGPTVVTSRPGDQNATMSRTLLEPAVAFVVYNFVIEEAVHNIVKSCGRLCRRVKGSVRLALNFSYCFCDVGCADFDLEGHCCTARIALCL